jgi:2-methylfumaryl-CoA isomerase
VLDILSNRLGLDLHQESNRFKAKTEIMAVFERWFSVRNVEYFSKSFDDNRVTWAVFSTFKQAVKKTPDFSLEHPVFSTMEQPGIGYYPVPSSPFKFSEFQRLPLKLTRLL